MPAGLRERQWALLLQVNRPRYLDWEAEEQQSRDMLGKDVSILRDRNGRTAKPLTLRTFRERIERQSSMFDADDWGACGCDMAAAQCPRKRVPHDPHARRPRPHQRAPVHALACPGRGHRRTGSARRQAVETRHDYEMAFAKAFLSSDGAMDVRKQKSVQITGTEKRRRRLLRQSSGLPGTHRHHQGPDRHRPLPRRGTQGGHGVRGKRVHGMSAERQLIDPACRGKDEHTSCLGDPCECWCHTSGIEGVRP